MNAQTQNTPAVMAPKMAPLSRGKALGSLANSTGHLVDAYLRERGLKAREFAAEIGVKPASLSHYIAGRKKKCGREAMDKIKAAFIECGIQPRPITKQERNCALLRRFHTEARALIASRFTDKIITQEAVTRDDVLFQMGMPF